MENNANQLNTELPYYSYIMLTSKNIYMWKVWTQESFQK